MNIGDLKQRIDELIDVGNRLIATKHTPVGYGIASVDRELFNQFKTSSLSFINNLYGIDHSYYKEFRKQCDLIHVSHSVSGLGILKAIKQELEGGWIFTVRSLVSAEIFSNFLEMADYLLTEGYKDPSAVMIGSILEEHLRQLSTKHNITTTYLKGDKLIPKKADSINAELTAKDVYNKLDQKSVTSWLDLRNKAAHGHYSDYSKEQVNLMLQGVTNFISRTS